MKKNTIKDISTYEDIQLFVNLFYKKLEEDLLLKDIFFARLGTGDWQHHLTTIYNFWATVLLQHTSYKGQSFLPHFTMNLQQMHFDRWLQLFDESIDYYFEGPMATDAKIRAKTMAVLFMSKINYYKDNGGTPLV
jgi:hemoglobin